MLAVQCYPSRSNACTVSALFWRETHRHPQICKLATPVVVTINHHTSAEPTRLHHQPGHPAAPKTESQNTGMATHLQPTRHSGVKNMPHMHIMQHNDWHSKNDTYMLTSG